MQINKGKIMEEINKNFEIERAETDNFKNVLQFNSKVCSICGLRHRADAYCSCFNLKKTHHSQDSKIGIYQKMWRFMESKRPSVFVSTYEEGVKRVLDGNYAFLMESTMLDYAVQRDCNLTQIGGLLDSKGYGIATPKGQFQREMVNRYDSLGVVEMQGTVTGNQQDC